MESAHVMYGISGNVALELPVLSFCSAGGCWKLIKRERNTMVLASFVKDALMIAVAIVAGGAFGIILKKFFRK